MSRSNPDIEALLTALKAEIPASGARPVNFASDVRATERESLMDLCGFEDDAFLEKLIANGVTSNSFAALRFIPLVLVAWSDGEVHEDEREAVLQATVDVTGIGWGTRAYRLLSSWLEFAPDERMVALWREYALALSASLDPPARKTLRARILGDAFKVAQVSGGLLGIGRVNDSEVRALDSLEEVFTPSDAADD